jgi:hypothetical protein
METKRTGEQRGMSSRREDEAKDASAELEVKAVAEWSLG